ncbi:hypothetical protein [Streptomyces altiplanensis]
MSDMIVSASPRTPARNVLRILVAIILFNPLLGGPYAGHAPSLA